MPSVPENLDVAVGRVAAALKAEGAREVYLFGSAADGRVRPDSDIDLAVVGLPPHVFFRAVARASRESARPVDVIDLDEDSLFTRYLRARGGLRRVA